MLCCWYFIHIYERSFEQQVSIVIMKKFPLLLLALMLACRLTAQLSVSVVWTEQTSLPVNDVIYYDPSLKLEWNDFRGKPVLNGNAAAVTMSGFGYAASVHALRNKGKLDISVYCFFDKQKSWVKPGNKTDYILTHEQHHFDLSYLAAQHFIDRILKKKLTLENYENMLRQLYDESIDDMNKMQDNYDSQTKNGQDERMQEKWNKMIDAGIAEVTM